MSRAVIVGDMPSSRFLEAVRRLFSGPQCLIPPNTESKCIGEVWRNEEMRRLRGASVTALLREEPFAQGGANALGIDAKKLLAAEAAQQQEKEQQQQQVWRALLWLTFAAEQERNCVNVEAINSRIREAYVRGDENFPRFITLRSLAAPKCLFFDDVVRHWNGETQLSHSIALDWPLLNDLTTPALFRVAWPLLPTFEDGGAALTAEQAESLARYTQQIASTSADNAQKQAYEKAAAYLQACFALLSARAAGEALQAPSMTALTDANAARLFVERIWGTRVSAASGRGEGREEEQGTVLQRWNARQERETMWARIRAIVPGQEQQALAPLLASALDSVMRCGANEIRDAMHGFGFQWQQKQEQQQQREEGEWKKSAVVEEAAVALPPLESWFPELPSSGRSYFDAWVVALMTCAQKLGSFHDEHASIHMLYSAIQSFNAVRASRNVQALSTDDIVRAKEQVWRELQTAARGQLDPGRGSPNSLAALHEQFDAIRPQPVVRRAEWGFATSSPRVSETQYRQGPQALPRNPYWLPYSTRYQHRLTSLELLLKLERASGENAEPIATNTATFAQKQTLYFSFVFRNNGPTTYTGQLRVVIEARKQQEFAIVGGAGEKSFIIDLQQPLQPGAQIDVGPSHQVAIRVARSQAATEEEIVESLNVSIGATRNTNAFTAWTYASQISLCIDRLAQRLQDGTRAAATLMRQPVDAALLVPFSRTLVDVTTGVQRRFWGAAVSEDDDNPPQRILVVFNDQRLNLVRFPHRLDLAQGSFLLVAAIFYNSVDATFETLYRKNDVWFAVRHAPVNASDSVEMLREPKALREFGCNAHRVVQAWYVLSDPVSGASLRLQAQQMSALQGLLPSATARSVPQPSEEAELNTITTKGQLITPAVGE